MVGRVFPKDRDLEHLSLGSLCEEHCVSYAEASWTKWVKGSCGVPHPALQCWPERVGWGLCTLGGLGACEDATPQACRELEEESGWADSTEGRVGNSSSVE